MKKLWNNNRVLFFLLTILLICIIAIVVVAMTFFYSKGSSEYGERLNNIEKHPFTTEIKDSFEEALKKNSSVKEVTYRLPVRTIFITISFDEKITLEKAQKLVADSISLLTDDVLLYYDINITLQSDNFTIMGSRNRSGSGLSWNNNRKVETED